MRALQVAPTVLRGLRPAVESALKLNFLEQHRNLVLVAPQGLGKMMIAQNIAHQAVIAGHPALFTTASQLLSDCGRQSQSDEFTHGCEAAHNPCDSKASTLSIHMERKLLFAALSLTLCSAEVNGYQPDRLKTQDHVGDYSDGDHSDHTVACLADNANRQYATPHAFLGYQDYVIESLEPNVLGNDSTDKQNAFLAYAAYDPNVRLTGSYAAWTHRQYKVSAGPNLTYGAMATAPFQDPGTLQTADKATDGIAQGYPGDFTREWSTVGGLAGSWLQLSWSTPQIIEQVVLNDRPHEDDQITGSTLNFSDGSTVAIAALLNDGASVRVPFSKRQVTSLRLDVQSVSASTLNVGRSEIKVYGPPQFGINHALSAAVTASSQDVSTSQTAAKAIDNVVKGFPEDYTKEWATMGGGKGSWLRLSWSRPCTIDQVILYDRPNGDDQVTAGTLVFSDGTSVRVGELNNYGSPTPVVFPQRSVTWVEFRVSAVSATTYNIGLAEIGVFGPN